MQTMLMLSKLGICACLLILRYISLAVVLAASSEHNSQELQNSLDRWHVILEKSYSMHSNSKYDAPLLMVNSYNKHSERCLTEKTTTFIAAENATGLDLFRSHERAVLEDIVARYMAVPAESLYTPATNISIETPYIFFHQRKAAGSTLRTELKEAAIKLKLPYYIACHSGVPCDLYTLPHDRRYAIYAMHIEWGSHRVLATNNHTVQHMITNQETGEVDHHSKHFSDFSCLSNFRDPVSRVISCLYFRFLEKGLKIGGGRVCIDQLSIRELLNLLVDKVDQFSNSCLNEPFRILSGFLDEDIINSIGLRVRGHSSIVERQRLLYGEGNSAPRTTSQQRGHRDLFAAPTIHPHKEEHLSSRSHSLHEVEGLLDLSSGTVTPEPHLSALSAHIFNVTLMDRMTKCVPIILAHADKAELLSLKFPSLYEFNAFGKVGKSFRLQTGSYTGRCKPPTQEQINILRKLTALEKVLYEAVLAKMNADYERLIHRRV